MKKTKLFLSIASMCFALSVLVFGIYAAQQVNYQVNGTIVYDVTDCYIIVDTNVYYSPTYLTQTQIYSKMETIVASNDTTGLTQVTTQDLNYNSYTDTAEGDNQKQLTLTFEGEGEVSPKQVYFIVMNTTNVGELTTNIGVNTPVELPNNVYSVNSGLWTSVAQNASKRMVVAFALEDRASKVTAGPGQLSPNYTLTLKAEVDDENTELNVFSFNSGTKTISKTTALEDMEMDLYIPSYYNGYKVTTCGSFADCENLTSIHVPTTVAEVSEGVFANCKSLTALTLPFVGKKNYTSQDNLRAVELVNDNSKDYYGTILYLFGTTSGSGLISCSIDDLNVTRYFPASLTTINVLCGCNCILDYAFYESDGEYPISSINLHYGIGTLGDCAFQKMELLSMSMPKSLKSIGDGCFVDCSYLTQASLNEGLQTINDWAFGSCTSLGEITIPSTVTDIGDNAFGNCTDLQTVYVYGGTIQGDDSDHWEGSNIFYRCSSLENVTIGQNAILGKLAFYNHSSIVNVSIVEGIKEIGDYAFCKCSNIANVSICDGIEKLGDGVFGGRIEFCSEWDYQYCILTSTSGNTTYFMSDNIHLMESITIDADVVSDITITSGGYDRELLLSSRVKFHGDIYTCDGLNALLTIINQSRFVNDCKVFTDAEDRSIYEIFSGIGTYQYTMTGCFASDTEVTVWDDKKKRLVKKKAKDIKYTDKLLVWNFDEGRFDFASPLWIQKDKVAEKYTRINLSDGSHFDVIREHSVFDVDKQDFRAVVSNVESCGMKIGSKVFKEDGTTATIVSKMLICEEIEYTNIFTKYHMNLFTNGILTSTYFNNFYKIKDMKFVKENRATTDMALLDGVDKEWLDGMRWLEFGDEELRKHIGFMPQFRTYKDYVDARKNEQK